ncbi:MAG: arylamine N-acetyltransferase [Hyphomonas sp.]|nr:arylamine N-acetyltransferase [Hyphomonas sp.]
MTDRLGAYLNRIGYTGPLAPDLPTLRALCAAHISAVPFEDLDVQLGRPPGLDVDTIYEKIVAQRRGGWCYEMNGLFGWVLVEIGFDVMRVSGGVLRERMGDQQMGNHLCLIATLDRPYLVDVGFGSALNRPLPLEAGEHDCAPFRVTLSDLGDGYWRYSEQAFAAPFTYDFRPEPADEALLGAVCTKQGTDPASNFVLNLVAQRRSGTSHRMLRGKVLVHTTPDGVEQTEIGSADELAATLRDIFGLDVPEVARLWPKVCARHDELFGQPGA